MEPGKLKEGLYPNFTYCSHNVSQCIGMAQNKQDCITVEESGKLKEGLYPNFTYCNHDASRCIEMV